MKWELGEIDTFVGELWELATQAYVVPILSELRPATSTAVDLWRRSGPALDRQFADVEKLPLGQICITDAPGLQCERLIHIAASTVSRKVTLEHFEDSIERALMAAYHNTFRSLAIPAMFNEPGELTTQVVARVLVEKSMEHLRKAKHPNRIVLVVPTDYVHKMFLSEISRVQYGEPLV